MQKKAKDMGFVDGILFADSKRVPVPDEPEEPEEPEKEDNLTAMTYSPSTTIGHISHESVGQPPSPIRVRLLISLKKCWHF